MATLTGDELFEYLDHLNGEFERLKVGYSEDDFKYHMHSQMQGVLKSEKRFLENVHRQNAMLSFSGNGLPSIDSLRPDLEAMVGLGNEYKDIVESYRVSSKENNNGISYKQVSKDEWERSLQENKLKKRSKDYFDIKETENGKLELLSTREVYIDSIDDFSRNHPFAIINGKTKYQIAFGRLFDESEVSYLDSCRGLVLGSRNGLSKNGVPANLKVHSRIEDLDKLLTNFYEVSSMSRANVISYYISKGFAENSPTKFFETYQFNDDIYNIYLLERENTIRKFLWMEKEFTKEKERKIAVVKHYILENNDYRIIIGIKDEFFEQVKSYVKELEEGIRSKISVKINV